MTIVASAALNFQSLSGISTERGGWSTRGSLNIPRVFGYAKRFRYFSRRISQADAASYSCNKKNDAESENLFIEEAVTLKRKCEDVIPYLNDRCIFLVGMMGSGKTTVGKVLSEVLGYSFFDSDKLVEQAVGMYSVAQIFKERSEDFFRDNESKVLRDLSMKHRLVVATGGGAVIRPINWRYMRRGITVSLDVPLEALARRIAAVGTESRPLLHEPGDPYSKALTRLSSLSKERNDDYANADVTVYLQYIAFKQGHGDVLSLTPAAIATELLIKIESFLTKDAPVGRFTCKVKGE